MRKRRRWQRRKVGCNNAGCKPIKAPIEPCHLSTAAFRATHRAGHNFCGTVEDKTYGNTAEPTTMTDSYTQNQIERSQGAFNRLKMAEVDSGSSGNGDTSATPRMKRPLLGKSPLSLASSLPDPSSPVPCTSCGRSAPIAGVISPDRPSDKIGHNGDKVFVYKCIEGEED
ncbi:hypothetical protein EYF80_023452 [Liparis tanakae]|uniref:Uncharacterized protein n=1 Tax=Liparis tanakae TaxID=230148 RepID=A0A4Z2HKL9_9TELE|nr:hypothetical protein EYF80_023452 [Liparis tanakae]